MRAVDAAAKHEGERVGGSATGDGGNFWLFNGGYRGGLCFFFWHFEDRIDVFKIRSMPKCDAGSCMFVFLTFSSTFRQ